MINCQILVILQCIITITQHKVVNIVFTFIINICSTQVQFTQIVYYPFNKKGTSHSTGIENAVHNYCSDFSP